MNPILAGIGAKLAPWKLAIQFGLLAVAFLVGLRSGCSWQADRDARAIAKVEAKRAHAVDALGKAAEALRDVSRRTRAEQARAEVAAKANRDAVREAREAAKGFAARLVEIEHEVELARRRGTAECRAILETKPCAPLH